MAITVNCTQCGTMVAAPDSAVGKKGRCTVCGEIMDIPIPAPTLVPEATPGVRVVEEKLGLQEAGAGAGEQASPAQPARPRTLRENFDPSPAAPARDSLDELLNAPSRRPPSPRTSCGVIALIFCLIFVVMAGGAGALLYFVAWPGLSHIRGAAQKATAAAMVKRFAMIEQTHFTRFGEYARRISGPKGLSGANLITPDEAAAEAPPGAGQPYHGLCFRILTKQGSAAKHNAKSFIDARGRMTGGFAILAYEAGGDSVVQAYLCGPDGNVLEKTFDKNAGPGPESIQSYEPEGWTPVGIFQPQTTPSQN